MYIESVPNWNSPAVILLRESYREDGKVRKCTLCNLSQRPVAYVEGLRGVLKGVVVIAPERNAFTVIRSLPHGHVVRFCARDIGILDRKGSFRRFAPPRDGLREPTEPPHPTDLSGIIPVQNVDHQPG